MLQPLFEDDPTGARRPWLSLGLAALWIAVFAAAPSAERWGLRPGAAGLPGVLTSFALHAGAVHLAVGLVWLALCGPALESRFGMPFTAGLLVALLALQAAVHTSGAATARPVVGASAALTGLLAAATLRFARGGFRLRLGLPPHAVALRVPGLALPALWFVGEVALDAASGLEGPTRGSGYAAPAAAAGLGLAAAWSVARLRLEERGLRRAGPSLLSRRRAARLLARLAAAGDAKPPKVAVGLLEAALRAPAPDARLAAALWETAGRCERRDEALAPLLRFVADTWHGGRRDDALGIWRRLIAERPDAPLEFGLRLALAATLADAGQRRDAALTLRGALSAGRALSVGAALRLAQAARPIHPDTAIEAARHALASDAIEPAKRAKIEALIEALETDPARLEDLDLGPAMAPGPPPAPVPAEAPADSRALALDASPGRPAAAPDEGLDPHALAPEELTGGGTGGKDLLSEAESAALDTWELDPQEPGAAWELDAEASGAAELSPQQLDPADEIAAASAAAPRFASHKVVEATPLGVEDGALRLVSPGGQRSRLSLSRVQAVAVGALCDLDGAPGIVVDLLLNWNDANDGPLHVARLRSDRLDARCVEAAGSRPDAVRALVAEILEATGALALPGADAARGQPFRRFERLEVYEREVLLVDG